jgi:hypothetical protein
MSFRIEIRQANAGDADCGSINAEEWSTGFQKQPTMMDGVIKLAYGDTPPQKTANLEVAIELAYEALLVRIVDIAEVQKIATQLYNGKMPYSTHDLAAATALNVFRNADQPRREQLGQIQIFSRLAVVDWVKEKKINPMLAKAFEDTLYKMYKAQA